MTALVNLTPHEIVVRGPGGEELRLPPSGNVARVTVRAVDAGSVAGIPAVRVEYGPVEGLPAPEWDTVYVVSALVLSRCAGRTDVVAPDTGPDSAVRDADGRIVAVRRFVRASE